MDNTESKTEFVDVASIPMPKKKQTNPNSLKNLKPWPKGVAPKGAGRPLGQRDYATIYKEALITLAKLKNCDPETIENEILRVGLSKAVQGDYKFYKDLQDRLHGMPTQKTELTHAIKPVPILGDTPLPPGPLNENTNKETPPGSQKNFSQENSPSVPLVNPMDIDRLMENGSI